MPLILWLAGTAPAAGQEETAAPQTPTTAEIESLIRVLEDDDARARLIETLRSSSVAVEGDDLAAASPTFAARLALYTRGAAESAAESLQALTDVGVRLSEVLTGTAAMDTVALRRVALGVTLVVAAVFGAFLVLQLLFRAAQRGLAAGAAGGDFIGRLRRFAVAAALDLGTVVLAWAAGYAFALAVGQSGEIGIDQSLFLNAFLMIELSKALGRTALAPRWPALRLAPLDDTTAAYWYFWLSRLISLLGYTFLFVAPLLAAGDSPSAAEAVRIVVAFAAVAILVAIVLQNRDAVRQRLLRRAANARPAAVGRPLAALARLWHVLAIVYLIGVFGLWLASGDVALPFVLAATAESAIAIVVGFLLTTFIGRLASGGMRLPPDIKQRLPLLEARLNAFVPTVLRVVRVLATIVVITIVLQVWEIAAVGEWLGSGPGQRLLASVVSATLVLLVAGVVYLGVQSWIEYRLSPDLAPLVSVRERTLLALFRNAFTIVLAVIVAMLVLSELGVNIGPLLAGAGVVGLAVGFGGQKLVQDVINGVFIQFENTMNEGDVVTAAALTGVVERLTIRSVSLRSVDGVYHVIPFSAVTTVSNFVKHFSYHVAAIGVAYRENVTEVKQAMEDAFERLKQMPIAADIIGPFEMQGLVEFADSSVIVRGRIKTRPGKQWALGRAYNELLKEVFDERGIEIPFPHLTMYFGEDKKGRAPPLRIQTTPTSSDAEPS